MNRITFRNPDGTWGISGYEIKMLPALYSALCKLRDYEETDLSPDEIISIKESYQKKCQDENLTVMEVWNLVKELIEDRHLQIKEFEIKYGQKTITDVFENCTPQDVKDNVTRWKTERKVAEERADSLIKIMKIVNTESHALTNDDRKNLALIIERLLDESASAHVSQDADGEIEVTVYDSIYRKPLATLEIKKVCDHLHFKDFHFYEKEDSGKADVTKILPDVLSPEEIMCVRKIIKELM